MSATRIEATQRSAPDGVYCDRIVLIGGRHGVANSRFSAHSSPLQLSSLSTLYLLTRTISPVTEPATKPSKSALLIIFVTVFIDLLGFGIVLPLMARYAKSFEATKPMLALLMASFSAMQFLFAPAWGRLSDRIGRRPVLLIGLLGSTAFYAMFGIITAMGKDGGLLGVAPLIWLLVSRIGAGICGATIPTAQAYIADVTGAAERTKGMALVGAAFGIGFTFGPLLGAMFVSSDPNAPPSPGAGYLASGLSGLAFLWAVFKLPESLRPGSIRAEGGFKVSQMLDAFRHPGLGLVMATVFLTTVAFGQFETTLGLLTRALGLADRQNFYVFAYVGFVLSLTNGGLVRPLSKRVAPHVLGLAGALVMMAGMAVVGMTSDGCAVALVKAKAELTEKGLLTTSDESTDNKPAKTAAIPDTPEAKAIFSKHIDDPLKKLYWAMAVLVVGYSTLTPSLFALISLRTPDNKQGEFLGVAQSMSALARIMGPVIGMSLFDDQHVAQPYWAGAGILVVGVALVAMLGKGPKCSAEVAAGA